MKLAHKIALALGGLLLAQGLISALLLNRLIDNRLLAEQEEWAAALTTAMAEGIVNDTLNGDALQVRETLRNITHSEKRVVYAYVVNFEGRLFAHSFENGFPKDLNDLEYPAGKNSLTLSTGKGNVLNIRHPLVKGTEANLYLGISLAKPEQLVSDLQWQRMLIFLGVSLIGLLLATYLGRQLSRPMDHLIQGLRAFGAGAPVDAPVMPGASQEIRELGLAFQQMMDERARLDAALRQARDELEDRVRQRTSELKAMNDELESFAYSVSHDLRSPLRGIDGFSQALLEDYSDCLDDTGKDYLGRVRSGTQRMSQLIDDLLKLSRLSRTSLQVEAVDLSALAQDIVQYLATAEPWREVAVQIMPSLQARGDPGLLRTALENLLDNAWKYSAKTTQAQIEFGARVQDGKTVYFVRDNGVGFDMKYADKLFGAFQRLHHRDEFEGTGIGLATVQRIIHRHGGRVWAQAEPGRGATFSFTLEALPLQ